MLSSIWYSTSEVSQEWHAPEEWGPIAPLHKCHSRDRWRILIGHCGNTLTLKNTERRTHPYISLDQWSSRNGRKSPPFPDPATDVSFLFRSPQPYSLTGLASCFPRPVPGARGHTLVYHGCPHTSLWTSACPWEGWPPPSLPSPASFAASVHPFQHHVWEQEEIKFCI